MIAILLQARRARRADPEARAAAAMRAFLATLERLACARRAGEGAR